MKFILNKTRSSWHRYTLIDEGMGGAGDPPHYPTHRYSVVNGVDRGNGYQGYSSIRYFLKEAYVPARAKRSLSIKLREMGFGQYVDSLELDPWIAGLEV